MISRVRALLLVPVLVMALVILAGCGPTPEPETIIQTVEVEVVETVEVEVVETVEVVVEVTVEVEKEVTVVATVKVEPTVAVPAATPDVQAELAEIDRSLKRTVLGNIAYNVPSSMHLDETIDIQLLLSPSLAATELEQRIAGPDPVRSASVDITPKMQAELWADEPDAFDIHPYHADAIQLVSSQEPTEWKWAITARKEGLQTLNLTLHRVVEYDGIDHWRKLQEYETTIQVKVTFGKWVAGLDWKFLVATVIAVLGLPLAVWKLLGQHLRSLWGQLAHRHEQEQQ